MDSSGKWHFSIQSAWVYPRILNIYEKPLKEKGFTFNKGYYYYSHESDFNLLRKIQLTYSINQKFEVGTAVFWQGERRAAYYRYNNSYNYNESFISFSNDITGYYAVGIYNLLSQQQTKFIDIKLGLALGSANVNFEINKAGNYYGNENFSHKIDKALYSQIAFAEILFKPIHGISFGLAADYSETPAQTIPEIPLINNTQIPPTQTFIKSKKISFGNSSVGFLMRLNF